MTTLGERLLNGESFEDLFPYKWVAETCPACHTPLMYPRFYENAAHVAHREQCLGWCHRPFYGEYCPYDNYSGRR